MNDRSAISDIASQMRQSRKSARKRKASSAGFWLGVLGVTASVAMVVGVLMLNQIISQTESEQAINGNARQTSGQPTKSDPVAALIWGRPEQQLIREFLKTETPTGEWEEIRWSEANGQFFPHPMTKLDFRTENELGGMTKSYIKARYVPGDDQVALEGYGIRFTAWVNPEKYGLPPVRDTKNLRPMAREERKTNILENLTEDASDRMSKRSSTQ